MCVVCFAACALYQPKCEDPCFCLCPSSAASIQMPAGGIHAVHDDNMGVHQV